MDGPRPRIQAISRSDTTRAGADRNGLTLTAKPWCSDTCLPRMISVAFGQQRSPQSCAPRKAGESPPRATQDGQWKTPAALAAHMYRHCDGFWEVGSTRVQGVGSSARATTAPLPFEPRESLARQGESRLQGGKWSPWIWTRSGYGGDSVVKSVCRAQDRGVWAAVLATAGSDGAQATGSSSQVPCCWVNLPAG